MERPTGRDEYSDAVRAVRRPPGAPRWVKVSGVVVGALILLVVVLMLTGVGGSHGPGRHFSGSGIPATGDVTAGSDGPVAPASVEGHRR